MGKKICSAALIVLFLVSISQSSIYRKYYDEAYKIAQEMTLDQKIGQTIQVDFYTITDHDFTDPNDAAKYHLGSLLVGGNGCPDENGNMIGLPWMNENLTEEIYANSTMNKWQALSGKFKNITERVVANGKTYEIHSLLATDAVHNNQHVAGTILFPHNIGVSCSHNPDNYYNTGKWTGIHVKESGFNYAFAPTVAVSHNPQWGRFYETMGQEPEMIYKYGKAYTEGLQGKPSALTGVLGSVKHFIGDGATLYGSDEGNDRVDNFENFLYHNAQGYNGSVAGEIGNVMCSYSGINWVPMAMSPLLGSYLREDLGFDGFIISDYDEIGKVIYQQFPTDFQTFKSVNESLATIFNAGIDMFMIPSRDGFQQYIEQVKSCLQSGSITLDRLHDAVAKILSVKLALKLVDVKSNSQVRFSEEESHREESLMTPEQWKERSEASSEYQESLQAVHESIVLLKNENIIPLQTSSLQYIVLVGERILNVENNNILFLNYDNIGMQCGGWSLRWQGFEGNRLWQGQNKIESNASSILDGLKNLKSNMQFVSPNYTNFHNKDQVENVRRDYLTQLNQIKKNMNSKNTLILSVVGESPYAEFSGDVGIPYCQEDQPGCLFNYHANPYYPEKQRPSLDLKFGDFDRSVINSVRQQDKSIPMLTVMLAGRPMLINDLLQDSQAMMTAFLPGTSGGQGIVDAITGSYKIRPAGSNANSLSFDWPKNTEQLSNFPIYRSDGKVPKIQDPLFPVGYGLSSSK